MFLLQSKSVHFLSSLVFVGTIVSASRAENENAVKKDDQDDSTQQESKPEDFEDHPQTELEEEADYIFLTAEEAKDFLGIGSMFEDPEHHKILLEDYVMMEQTDYWTERCDDEMAARYNHTTDDSAASFQKPDYCS